MGTKQEVFVPIALILGIDRSLAVSFIAALLAGGAVYAQLESIRYCTPILV